MTFVRIHMPTRRLARTVLAEKRLEQMRALILHEGHVWYPPRQTGIGQFMWRNVQRQLIVDFVRNRAARYVNVNYNANTSPRWRRLNTKAAAGINLWKGGTDTSPAKLLAHWTWLHV